ncbi:MAG: hypothetical protein DRJ41_00940 [Thermoprotei archaeon]|nr:MAG: hypothetical protein DRJ41_00940 [Thermoprotei archaeon]
MKTELTKEYSREIEAEEGDVIRGRVAVIRTRCSDGRCGTLIFRIRSGKEELYSFPLTPESSYSLPSKEIEFICPHTGRYTIEVKIPKSYSGALFSAISGALIGGAVGGFFSIPLSLLLLRLRYLRGIGGLIVLGVVVLSALIGLLVGISHPSRVEVYSLELWLESLEEDITRPYG